MYINTEIATENAIKISLKISEKQEGKIEIRLIKFFALASLTKSSYLAKRYLFRSMSKNEKTCFNFSLLSKMRHSY